MLGQPLRAAANWRLGSVVRSILFYVTLSAFMVTILLPIYYIFLVAFAPGERLFSTPLSYTPQSLGIDRFRSIFEALPIGRYLLNTFLISTVSAFLTVLICFLAAYAIARLQVPGANIILIGLLVSSMLPWVSTVIPLFQMYQRLNLINTIQGLLLLYVSALLPFTTWVLISFIKQIPSEVEEAARVDGAGFVVLLWQIVVPMVAPAMATLFLINFIVNWNEFFTPLIFARGEGSKVITMALSDAQTIGAQSEYYLSWANMSAVAMLATIPVFVITLIFQRRITEGITTGAVK